MPTGGATGNATGLIGSAPTAAGGVCWSGGADEAGEIESLKERVAKLEQALQYVLGQDISADKLSDISQNAGWIYGVEYMGVEGWTKTASGTLIPPAGFSLSGSGLFKMYDFCTGEEQDYQGVSVDEDGVIQFGFKPNGQVCGEKVDQWDAAASGIPDYYKFYISNAGINDQAEGSGITAGVNSYSVGAGVYSGSVQFTISREGLYLVQQSATFIFSGGTSPSTLLATQGILSAGTNAVPTKWYTERNDIQWLNSIYANTFQDPTGDLLHMNMSEVFLLDTTNNKISSSMTAFALPGANLPADIHFLRVNVSVVRLGGTE
jgi:hypothetical protein